MVNAAILQSRVGVALILTVVVVILFPAARSFTVRSELDDNLTPIVGILTQEVSQFVLRNYPGKNLTSYIAASYVKFVEGAGARAVPIWTGESREYYEDILSKVNGILLPGGATYFNQSNGYADAGHHIYEVAVAMNSKGTYFPVWGTCLGFELLTYLALNRTEHRSACSSSQQPLPLEFKQGYESSKMFEGAPSDVITILQTMPVTANFHQYCITEKTFAEYGLDKEWDVLSLNHDWNNFEFISSIEHKKYPFYGVQFHPEKNLFEFVKNRSIPHSLEAIQASQYFSDFFISETRKNTNRFSDEKEEQDSLIYNYSPEFTGRIGSSFIQQYLFEGKGTAKSVDNTNQLGGTYVSDKPNDIDVTANDIVLQDNKDELK